MQNLDGQTVGRYEIRSLVGKGGMGEVYLAWDTRLHREIALKRLSPEVQDDPQYRKRFLKEAERAAALNHQNIAALHDVLEHQGEVFLVMEFVEGESLDEKLDERPSVAEFLHIAIQITEGLCAAHDERIVHRDVKPSNIRVSASGNVKILDFGVARLLPCSPEDARTATEDSTSKGSIIGTPAYMAPEVLTGRCADQRSDLFSLGIVFYQALTGRHPYAADTFAVMINRMFQEQPTPVGQLNPNVPEDLERLVTKLLAKDTDERYATAADVLADLCTIKRRVSPSGVFAREDPEPTPLPLGRWLAYGLATALVITAVLVAHPYSRGGIVRWLGFAPLPEIRHVAVLAFEVGVDDPEPDEAALARGLSVGLTEKLSRLTREHRNLTIAGASEVHSYEIDSAQRAAEEVGANLILRGVLEFDGAPDRLSLHLEDVRGALREGSIGIENDDLLLTEERLLDAAVDLLGIEWAGSERRQLIQAGTAIAEAHTFLVRGRGYLWDGDDSQSLMEAITEFDSALRIDGQYAAALAGVGRAHWRLYAVDDNPAHLDASIAACESAVGLVERLFAANLCLADTYRTLEHHEFAARYFERALNQEPTNPQASAGLARIYSALGRLGDAEQVLQQAIERLPNSWRGYYQLGYLYWRNLARHSEAVEMFSAAIDLAPETYFAYTALGAVLEQSGRNQEAIRALETATGIREEDWRARNSLATLYFYEHNWPEATRLFREAINHGHDNAVTWGNLGDIRYWTAGERDNAVACYEKALELAKAEPKEAIVLARMAVWSAMLGREDEAFAYMDQALEMETQNPAAFVKAAQAHAQFDHPEEAIRYVELAINSGYDPDRLLRDPAFEGLKQHPLFDQVLSVR